MEAGVTPIQNSNIPRSVAQGFVIHASPMLSAHDLAFNFMVEIEAVMEKVLQTPYVHFLSCLQNPYEFSLPSRESGDVLYFCSLCLRSNYLSHLDVLHTIRDFLSPEFSLVLSVIVIMLSPPLFSCIKEYRVHLQQQCFTHIDPWIIKLETVPEWSLVPKMIRWHTEPSISFYLSLIWLLEVF